MKRRLYLITLAAILLVFSAISPLTAAADEKTVTAKKYFNIATMETRPLYIDRLLYVALMDLGYQADFTYIPLETGYDLTNSGERDGVIASLPDMAELYPNLVEVPVDLDNVDMYAIVREDSKLTAANGWKTVKGLKTGAVMQRPYTNGKIVANEASALIVKENNALLLEGLKNGEYDLAIFSNRTHEGFVLPEGLRNIGIVDSLPERLFMHSDNAEYIPEITSALLNLFSDGRAERILSNERIPEINHKQTVLHIFSTNKQIPREEQFTEMLRKPFEEDYSIEWYTVELNSRRFQKDPTRLQYYTNLLRQDCISRDVAAIVVSGEEAVEFLTQYYYMFFGEVPVFFYNLSENSEQLIRGFEKHFTGIIERIPAAETLDAALELFPDTKKLYVLNDHTTEGENYREMFEAQLAPYTATLDIEYSDDATSGAILERIKQLPENTLVLTGSYFTDSQVQYYTLNEMKNLLERNCSAPIFSVYSTNVDYNAIGGKALDYERYGEIAAEFISRALYGEAAEDAPFIDDSDEYSRWVFDKNMLDRFGILNAELPNGSEIINKTPSIWQSDPRFAVTLLALFVLGISATIVISWFVIRNRRHKERAIRDARIGEVKERLERIINTAPLAFMSSVDGVVVEVNEYMRQSIDAEPGQSARCCYDNPERRDELIAQASEGPVENQVQFFKTHSGKRRFLTSYNSVEYDGKQGYILWAMDIEDTEQQRDELEEVRHNLQTIVDSMPTPIRITDSEGGIILYANNACLELFGCRELSEMAGKPVMQFLPETQSDGVSSTEMVSELLRGNDMCVLEMEYLTASGITEAAVTTCSIVYNGINASLATIIDLSAEKKRQRMLENAAEQEKEANQLKSRFLVNMSHEIRTPMNAIIGLTEIELHKDPPKEAKEIYKKINISAKNLLEIINDILDQSKIEADKIELYEEEFELEDVLNSALLVASPRLDGKNVEFMLNAALDLPRFLIGDRTRLWQILKNFLDNSAKFTEKGKIALIVYADNARSNDETIYITFVIKDTGIGISKEHLEKLFQPYEQVRNEAQKRYSGTGLGLAISKQLCEIMGGELQVQSEIGEGTTSIIGIPFKRSENSETELQAIKSSSLEGLDILAVDDDKLSREIMSNLLVSAGANCVLAESGQKAMDVIYKRRDENRTFDVILLDYMMEGLNGLETAKQIHLSLSKSPKLLMVTAYQKLLLKQDLEQNGIDDIIEKPFIPSQFMHKLCTVLGIECDDEEATETFMRFKDVRVLLCEDYRLNQEVALGMFSQFGVETDVADDGAQGIALLNAGYKYDLIFMDLQMPVLDGFEATRIIRADKRFDDIPIVSLTADAMKEIVDSCMEAGMNDHVAKPIEFSALQRVFMRWLPESKRDKSEEVEAARMDGILMRFGGDLARYNKAMLEFARTIPAEWESFENALKNRKETGFFVHKLKGASGNLGEKDIYELCAQFEASLRSDNPSEELYTRMTETCSAVRARIFEEIKEETEAIPAEQGAPEEFNGLMEQLVDALENYEPVASVNIVNQMKEKSWPFADEKKLSELYQAVRTYNFEAALELAEAIKGSI